MEFILKSFLSHKIYVSLEKGKFQWSLYSSMKEEESSPLKSAKTS